MQTLELRLAEYLETHLSNRSHVGMFCSGGFDSTTVAYCVFKHVHNCRPDMKITVFTVPRTDDSLVHSRRILNWLSDCFPETRYTHEIVGDPNLYHSDQVRSGINQALNQYQNLVVVLGDTGIPPELKTNSPERFVNKNVRVIQPFIHSLKTETILLANELKILDQVAKLSHSCTESTTTRCNLCWQCRERAWAFNQTNQIDRGTM